MDKMCSLSFGQIVGIILCERIEGELARQLEESMMKTYSKARLTNMSEITTERNRFSFIENHILYNNYNNMFIFQEHILVDRNNVPTNSITMQNDLKKTDLVHINIDQNKEEIFHKEISEIILESSNRTDKLVMLNIMVCLGRADNLFDIDYLFGLINRNTDSYSNLYSKSQVALQKDYLYFNIRNVNWDEILKLKLSKTFERNKGIYIAKKILVAGYYKLLICMYDGETDKFFYALYKMQLAIKFLVEIHDSQINSDIMDLKKELYFIKVPFFESSGCINNRLEIEEYLNEFLSIR